jgi:hypothetical protein
LLYPWAFTGRQQTGGALLLYVGQEILAVVDKLEGMNIETYDGRGEPRRCGVCKTDQVMDALEPGWTVVQAAGEAVWSCPDCCRKAGPVRPAPARS